MHEPYKSNDISCNNTFSAFRSFSLCIVKIVTPCSIGFGLLAGPWWDSEIENLLPLKPREDTDV